MLHKTVGSYLLQWDWNGDPLVLAHAHAIHEYN